MLFILISGIIYIYIYIYIFIYLYLYIYIYIHIYISIFFGGEGGCKPPSEGLDAEPREIFYETSAILNAQKLHFQSYHEG